VTRKGYDATTGAQGDRLGEATSGLIDQAGQTAEAQVSSVMTKAGDTLSQVAQAVRQSGEGMRDQQPVIADVADTAARRVEDLSSYLREHDAREVFQTVEDFARRQPAVVLAGGLALGLALGRFLKSAQGTGDGSVGAGAQQGYGAYGGYGASSGYGTPGYGTPGYGTPGYGTPGYGTPGYGTTGRDMSAAGYAAAGAAGMTEGAVAGRTRTGSAFETGGEFAGTGEDTGTTNAYGAESSGYEPDTLYDTDRVAAMGGYGSDADLDEPAGTDTSGIRSTGTTETTDLESNRGA